MVNDEVDSQPLRQLQLWFWLLVTGFLLHNVEEVLGMPAFLHQVQPRLPVLLQPYSMQITADQFTLAIWLLNGASIVLAWLAAPRLNQVRVHRLASLFALIMLVNTLSHLSQNLVFGVLSPGSVSGMVLLLPFAGGFLLTSYRQRRLRGRQLILLSGLAMLLFPLAAAGILALSGWLMRLRSE